jgi:S1-C subfamily serine protease
MKSKRENLKKYLFVGVFLAIFFFGGVIGSVYGRDILWGLKYVGVEINNYLKIFPEIKLQPKQEISQPQVSQPSPTSTHQYIPQTTQEKAVIEVVKKVSPAVVSIIITKELPVFEEYYENPFPELPGFPEFKIPQYRQKGVKKQKVSWRRNWLYHFRRWSGFNQQACGC